MILKMDYFKLYHIKKILNLLITKTLSTFSITLQLHGYTHITISIYKK